MKVVALASGGKDSCYVMLKCLSYGHDIVALAHITPPSAEADSFMYQSVGSAAVPSVAAALGLPLFTRPTTAVARVQTLFYTPAADDEVEHLYRLLLAVKAAHPAVDAVCAGALWSDYQRLRVESAASRAGMLSLAYLWRRDQTELLDEMVAAGVHAVLVKVAAVGLGEEHLRKSLAEMRGLLKKLERMYGVHVCGEGGEYETLVLSLPTFEKDIVLGDVEVVRHQDDPVAPVSYLALPRLQLEAKAPERAALSGKIPPVPPRPLALRPLPEGEDVFVGAVGEGVWEGKYQLSPGDVRVQSSETVRGYTHIVVRCGDGGAAGVSAAARALRSALAKTAHGAVAEPLSDVLYVWLALDSLSGAAYADANAAYTSVFGSAACTPPPARACVGMSRASSPGAPVVFEALARSGRRDLPSPDGDYPLQTSTLHVQSISEWAPPCIGPYAQTVSDRGTLHICGVLPLDAPTAAIPEALGARGQVRAAMHNMECTLSAASAAPDAMKRLRVLVAYVVSRRCGVVVEEEVRKYLSAACVGSGEDAPAIAVVPVDALPKGAIVEVRAVAARGPGDSRSSSVSAAGDRVLWAGDLGYSVITVKSNNGCGGDEALELAARVVGCAAQGDTRLLSLQVFCCRDGVANANAVRAALDTSDEVVCAAMVADVDWLDNDASVMCIATFVER